MAGRLGAVLVVLAAFVPAVAGQGTAFYTVQFEAVWSAATHPTDFPGNPHFSGLVGGTHNSGASFWQSGRAASPGIQVMAETGSKEPLRSEVQAAIQAGTAFRVLSGPGLSVSPGTTSYSFESTADYPLVTLVSMIAPSPDWFVGVNGLELLDNGQWRDNVTVELRPYDAGTDSGPSYVSPNQPTSPATPISRIQGEPFLVGGNVPAMARFTFRLDMVAGGTQSESVGELPRIAHLLVYPNPSAGQVRAALTLPEAQVVQLVLTDVRGREVARLPGQYLEAGRHVLPVSMAGLATGIYFLRMEGRGFRLVRPLARVR